MRFRCYYRGNNDIEKLRAIPGIEIEEYTIERSYLPKPICGTKAIMKIENMGQLLKLARDCGGILLWAETFNGTEPELDLYHVCDDGIQDDE
jgi:hypothetical protein